MEEKKMKYRIGTGGAIVFIGVALLADLLTLIPIVGDIVSPIFWVCASVYLWRCGLGFSNWKSTAPRLVSFVAEMIPGVQELPTIVLAAVVVVAVSRFEDKTGIRVAGLASQKTGSLALNQGGRREPRQNPEIVDQNAGPLNLDGMRQPIKTASVDEADTDQGGPYGQQEGPLAA